MRAATLGVLTAALVLAGCANGESQPSASTSSTPTRSAPASTPGPKPTRTTAVPRPDPDEQRRLDAALIKAAWQNDGEGARELIARGADVNAKDETVQSAYLIATSEGYLELLNLTLEHGGDVDSKDSFNGTGLIRAADRGHADIAGRLVQAEVKIDHINNLGWTALHEAIILGDGSGRYVDTVRVLVAAGADLRLPSQRDGSRRSSTPAEGPRRDRRGAARGARGGPARRGGWPTGACSPRRGRRRHRGGARHAGRSGS